MKLMPSFIERELLMAKNQFWHPKAKIDKKVLFCYKEYQYDYSMYSMVLFLLRNYNNLDVLGFSASERPRENPGLSSEKLFSKIKEFEPEIIITNEKILSHEEVDFLVKQGIRLITMSCGFTSFNYGALAQSEAIECLAKYSLYLIPHAPHVSTLLSVGVHAMEFPFWFDPGWFHPLKKEKKFDILFFGDFSTTLNRNRLELIKILSKNHTITILSDKNPEIENVNFLGTTTNPNRLNEWINSARITISSDRIADKNSINDPLKYNVFLYDDEFFIRQRTYLTMGANACYFVEQHEEIEKKFKNGKEIVLWKDNQDLDEKIIYYLEHHHEREQIGKNAAYTAKSEYSTSVSMHQLLNLLKKL